MSTFNFSFSFLERENNTNGKGRMSMRETGKDGFQAKLKKELKEMFPGCIITKLDSGDIQGIPDLLILYKNKWATLEVKANAKANRQPNQEYYVDQMDNMSFSRFIYPENKDIVLDELGYYFDIYVNGDEY